MILLTKLNNNNVLVSLETIKYIEATPDTIINFVNGETVVVKESLDEVESKVKAFQKDLLNDK